MDSSQPLPNPSPTPATPNVTPSPAPVAPTPIVTPTPPAPPVAPSGGKKTGLIIAIVLGILAVVIIAGLVIFGGVLANVQAFATTTSFMSNITQGNTDEALKLTDSGPDSEGTRSFLSASSKAVSGSFKKQESKRVDNKMYTLYNLTNEKNKYARVTVAKVGPSWKVTSFVYSPNSLALIPTSSTASLATTPAPTAEPSTCLIASDFDTIYKDVNGSTFSRPANLDYSRAPAYFTQNVHFKPDSLEFTSPAQDTAMVTAFGNFAKQNSTRTFKLKLRGSVGTTKQADLNFANQRAEKIKAMLVAQGVSASSIALDAPHNVASSSTNTTNKIDQQTARNVVLTIDSTCSASAASSTTGR